MVLKAPFEGGAASLCHFNCKVKGLLWKLCVQLGFHQRHRPRMRLLLISNEIRKGYHTLVHFTLSHHRFTKPPMSPNQPDKVFKESKINIAFSDSKPVISKDTKQRQPPAKEMLRVSPLFPGRQH